MEVTIIAIIFFIIVVLFCLLLMGVESISLFAKGMVKFFKYIYKKICGLIDFIFIPKNEIIKGNVVAMMKEGSSVPSHVRYLNPFFIIVPRYLIKVEDSSGGVFIINGIPVALFLEINFQEKINLKCKKYKWSKSYFFSAVIET